MSQKAQQDQNMRHAPTLKQDKQDKPITDLSPDDDIGVKPEDTGKPGAPVK